MTDVPQDVYLKTVKEYVKETSADRLPVVRQIWSHRDSKNNEKSLFSSYNFNSTTRNTDLQNFTHNYQTGRKFGMNVSQRKYTTFDLD